MATNDRFEQFIQQAKSLLPSDSLSNEFEPKLRALASSLLAKMDVVSREEFEAQSAVLLRTREKIDALEKQLQALQTQR